MKRERNCKNCKYKKQDPYDSTMFICEDDYSVAPWTFADKMCCNKHAFESKSNKDAD